MKTIQELKEIIVDLKVSLAKANIPYGHCPYAYYPGIEQNFECGDIGCDQCRRLFFTTYEKLTKESVEKL